MGRRRNERSNVRTLEQQIRTTDFAISRKGYDPASVDETLNGFADDVALLLAELRKESIRVSTLERSLTFAQNGGSSAQPDLATLMLEVTEKREKLLADAHARAAEILSQAEQRVGEPIGESQSASDPEHADLRERQIELALEEASAIEAAARDLADRIRSEAESDANRVIDAARAAAQRLDAVHTGTGADGVELAQHYE
jgi:cell division septum initiation protein DivIVA